MAAGLRAFIDFVRSESKARQSLPSPADAG
jgi:hypothetical protein